MFNKKPLKLAIWGALGTPIALSLISPMALASEQVVLKYNVFERSVSVEELTTFAETGKLSRDLKAYLRTSKQDPETIRQTLTDTVEVDVVTLDRFLNSIVGDIALERLSRYIYTSSRKADKQAMRAALVLSASEDNNISILEVAQNYPTEEVHIDGNRLSETYAQISLLRGGLDNLLERIRGVL
ncbi:MAG: alpha/beta hydrolase [Timaviella obliquedivisa GSE-PSE-MK23-08B]|nr:alpha/beta hydrolase [Timaviella obliquedivisa GSE-PSE-MK23-08B]